MKGIHTKITCWDYPRCCVIINRVLKNVVAELKNTKLDYPHDSLQSLDHVIHTFCNDFVRKNNFNSNFRT